MHTPWYLYNEMFLGLTKEDIILEGFLSNEGKTRKLMKLAAYVTLVQNESFLVMSNEMSEKKLYLGLTEIKTGKLFIGKSMRREIT